MRVYQFRHTGFLVVHDLIGEPATAFRTTLQAVIYIASIRARQKKIGTPRLLPASNAADLQ